MKEKIKDFLKGFKEIAAVIIFFWAIDVILNNIPDDDIKVFFIMFIFAIFAYLAIALKKDN